MTQMLFRKDAYLTEATGMVTGHTAEGGIVLDQCLFYPTGGGQPGDSGGLSWAGGQLRIATTVKGAGQDIVLVPGEPQPLPPVGTMVRQKLEWARRYRHMRMHTALHLLSVVIPLPVTGGAIGSEKGRLDFAMSEAPGDKDLVNAALNELIERDLAMSEVWISDEELLENPELIKTMSVKPPMGQGRVRLVLIGDGDAQIDLQPCGGTHVARTSEIGRVRLGKVENKGRQNRRFNLFLDS